MGLSLSVAEAHFGSVCPRSTSLSNGAVQHVVPGVWSQVLVLMLRLWQHLLGALPGSSQTSAAGSALNRTVVGNHHNKSVVQMQRI